MVHSSSSSSSSTTIKFLCSYGGKILPRHPDAKLRYHGGHTRVIAVHRSISFSELSLKFGELMSSSSASSSVCVRCQLPTEDLDALVSITSDEDLTNLIEEYDRVSSCLKIRAFLSLPKTRTIPSSSSSSSSSSSLSSSSSSSSSSTNNHFTPTSFSPSSSAAPRYSSRPAPACLRPPGKSISPYHKKCLLLQQHNNGCYVNGNNVYLIHNGNHNQWL